MARKEDESIGYVIPTHMLFDLGECVSLNLVEPTHKDIHSCPFT